MPWTPDMTGRLDQAAAELRAAAHTHGIVLGSDEVTFMLGLVVGWSTRHQDDFAADPDRWVLELHWLAAVVAVAGGNQAAAQDLRVLFDAWDAAREAE